MYTLTRTLPDGTTKTHSPVSTLKQACTAAGYVLHDNGYASLRDAREFVSTLGNSPMGETVEHISGYSFRIEVSA